MMWTRSRALHHGMMALLAAAWGLAFTAIKELSGELSFVAMNLARFLISIVVLLPALFFHRCRRPCFRRREWLVVLAAGVFAVWGYHLAVNLGETMASASAAGVVANTSPLFVVVLSVLLGRERVGWWKAAGVAVSFAGLVLVTLSGGAFGQGGSGELRGLLLVGLAAFSWAVYTVLLKPLLQVHHTFHVTAYALLGGLLTQLPLLLLVDLPGEISRLSAAGWAWLSFLGLGCTALGYLLYNRGVEVLGATTASLYIYLVAPFSVLWGCLLLGEPLTPGLAWGTAFVLAGFFLVEVGERLPHRSRRVLAGRKLAGEQRA